MEVSRKPQALGFPSEATWGEYLTGKEESVLRDTQTLDTAEVCLSASCPAQPDPGLTLTPGSRREGIEKRDNRILREEEG